MIGWQFCYSSLISKQFCLHQRLNHFNRSDNTIDFMTETNRLHCCQIFSQSKLSHFSHSKQGSNQSFAVVCFQRHPMSLSIHNHFIALNRSFTSFKSESSICSDRWFRILYQKVLLFSFHQLFSRLLTNISLYQKSSLRSIL